MNQLLSGWLLVTLLIIPSLQTLHGDDGAAVRIRAFEKRIAADSETHPHKHMASEAQSLLIGQFKMLAAAITREDFDKVQQLLANISKSGIPPRFQQEWQELAELTRVNMESVKGRAFDQWRADVDQVTVQARELCLSAASSAELEPLLVRAASLQMRRSGTENLLGQRAVHKLDGVVATLDAWARFLDYRDAENANAANNVLRSLAENLTRFPILPLPEIERRFIPKDLKTAALRDAIAEAFEGVKSLAELPAAVEHLKRFSTNPLHPEVNRLSFESARFDALNSAWLALEKGDRPSADRFLDASYPASNSPEAQTHFDRLYEQILQRLIGDELNAFSEVRQKPGESIQSFVQRITEHFHEKRDYPRLAQAMKLHERFPRNSGISRDRPIVERFLAGQRFESLGDAVAAVFEYRHVVGHTYGGRYVPMEAATEALQRLKQKNPDAFATYEGAVIEELRRLRHQIELLNRSGTQRSPGSGR